MQANLRFLFAHPAHFIACGFGSGLSPWAPGTIGTLAAWVLYPLIRPHFSDLGFALFLLAAFVVGVFAAARTGRMLGVVDHGAIVWDEIVPFWGVLLLAPQAMMETPHGAMLSVSGLLWQTAAFFLFRFFDIVKPPPASYFDRRVKNGFGVMMDDLVAAAYTVLALALAKSLLG